MYGKWGLVFLIIFSNLILSSCSRQNETTSHIALARKGEDIQYSGQVNWIGHWLGEDKRETLVREVATEFEFRNQGIQVNLKFPQEIMGNKSMELEADYIIKLMNSKKPEYDIVWLDDGIYQLVSQKLGDPNWGRKYLVDFAQYPEFISAHKEFIIKDPQYKKQTGGIFAGVFLEGYYYTLWYNKELAGEMGISIKDFGMTFDDFLLYIAAVDAFNKKNSRPISALYEASDWFTTQILFQNLYHSAFESNARSAQDKNLALKKTLTAFENLGKYKPLIPSYRTNKWFDTRDIPLNNGCLFYIQGTWMYNHWRGLDKEGIKKMVPAELPVFKPHDYYLGGYINTFAVLKNSPNLDNAVKLMLFWCRPDIAEKWVRYTKNPTGIEGNITASEIGSDVFERFQRTIIQKYGSRVGYSKDASFISENAALRLTSKLNESILQLLNGEITSEKAYEQLKF